MTVGSVGRALAGWAVVMCIATGASAAFAQPYAADGGFMRPRLVAGPGVVATIATASHQGVQQLVWADTDGVWRRPLFDAEAAPTRLAPAGSIRGVSATTAGGDIAVAWLQRDLRTGRTSHSVTWRSSTMVLFESTLEVPMLVGEAEGTPWVLVAPRADGRATIELYRVSPAGGLEEPVVLHSTTLNVTGVRASGSDPISRGPAHIAWLEGRTSSSAFGSDSEWHAYVMSTADGAAPLELGLADVIDVRQAVAIGPAVDGQLGALWLTVDGALELTTMQAAGDSLAVAGRRGLSEAGRPVAFAGNKVYWIADAFIRRATVDGSGQPVDATSVAWSPVPVEDAAVYGPTVTGEAAATGGGSSPEPVTTLAWYGRAQGGLVSAYASDDSEAFVPGFGDEVARVMRWSPWTVVQEAVGQALTSVLAGIIVTLGLAPLLFVLALVAAKARVAARPALLGALLGIALPVALFVVVALRYPSPQLAAALTLDGVLGALPWLIVGGVAGYLVARRSDNDGQLVTFVAACSAALVAITTLAFVNYHDWAAFVGIV
jgi:hypothetical protein